MIDTISEALNHVTSGFLPGVRHLILHLQQQ